MLLRQQLLGSWCSRFRICLEKAESRLRSSTEESGAVAKSIYRKREISEINLECGVYLHCTTPGFLMMNLLSRKLRSILWTPIYPFLLLFSPPGHNAFLRWPAPFQVYPSLKEDWRNPDWFLGTTLASSVRSQHNSANFTVRRCWKMAKTKELAAFMKFWKHKSVPSVHCEQLNPFHYTKKDEVIFWWAKKNLLYRHFASTSVYSETDFAALQNSFFSHELAPYSPMLLKHPKTIWFLFPQFK